MITIRAYKAIDNIELCEKFAEGHLNVLISRGVTNVTTANKSWFNDPNVYMIIAHSDTDNSVIGGVRIHATGNKSRMLPFEEAIGKVDKRVHDLVKKYEHPRVGELCGLWNSPEFSHRGIGTYYLMRAGIAVAGYLELNCLFALCAEHTLTISTEKGFEVETSIGKDGRFNYPKLNLVATAIKINDIEKLPLAINSERDIILKIREIKKITRQENVNEYHLNVNYDLEWQ